MKTEIVVSGLVAVETILFSGILLVEQITKLEMSRAHKMYLSHVFSEIFTAHTCTASSGLDVSPKCSPESVFPLLERRRGESF